jgi:hypothetical protein
MIDRWKTISLLKLEISSPKKITGSGIYIFLTLKNMAAKMV